MLRRLRFLVPVLLAVTFGLPGARPVLSAVTTAGGAPDFLLKTYTTGQTATPFEESYEPSAGWESPLPLTLGSIAQTPAVSEFDVSGSHDLFVLALRSDRQIYEAVYSPGTGWSDWSALPSLTGGASSAPAVAVLGSELHVFVRGAADDVWEAVYGLQGGSWSWGAWHDLTPGYGGVASAPAAATYVSGTSHGTLYVLWLAKKTREYIEMRQRSNGKWGRRSLQGCCYRSAPGVAQYMDTLQVWGVGMDKHLYQRLWLPGRGWSAPKRRTRDVIGSAPAVLQYVAAGSAQLEVFYIMGDYPGTWESKQLIFDPVRGWQPPVDWVFLSSAPTLAAYDTQLQVWARDESD